MKVYLMKKKSLLAILVLLCIGFSASGHATPFNCTTEACSVNLTTGLYSCVFNECMILPNFVVVNQTNVTIVNTTQIVFQNQTVNVTNVDCDAIGVVQAFQNETANFTDVIVGYINQSIDYGACRESREILKSNIAVCNDEKEKVFNERIDPVVHNECMLNRTLTFQVLQTETEDKNKVMILAGIVGIIIGYVLFDQTHKNPVEKNLRVPQGDFRLNKKELDRFEEEDEVKPVKGGKRRKSR